MKYQEVYNGLNKRASNAQIKKLASLIHKKAEIKKNQYLTDQQARSVWDKIYPMKSTGNKGYDNWRKDVIRNPQKYFTNSKYNNYPSSAFSDINKYLTDFRQRVSTPSAIPGATQQNNTTPSSQPQEFLKTPIQQQYPSISDYRRRQNLYQESANRFKKLQEISSAPQLYAGSIKRREDMAREQRQGARKTLQRGMNEAKTIGQQQGQWWRHFTLDPRKWVR